jgi:Asp-tRNA(Asn)/Glu-tRNA(Gln) amidotransferase A subunit family amidase
MSDLTQLTLAQARQKLVSKNISSVELTEAFLERLVAHRH